MRERGSESEGGGKELRPSEGIKTHTVWKWTWTGVYVVVRQQVIGFSEASAQDCSLPHHFSLLSAEALYYAAMFVEGGGIGNAEGYIPYTMVHVVI